MKRRNRNRSDSWARERFLFSSFNNVKRPPAVPDIRNYDVAMTVSVECVVDSMFTAFSSPIPIPHDQHQERGERSNGKSLKRESSP